MGYILKRLNLNAGKSIAFINQKDAAILSVHPGDRIKISCGSKHEISVIDVTTFVKKGQIGLSHEASDYLGAKNGVRLKLELLNPAGGSIILKQNARCAPYTLEQLKQIIRDVVNGALTEAEIAYFISGVHYCGMSLQETGYLIDAIVSSGSKISWGSKEIADKHSIGGIPGNRTTPIVVAICAAAGIIMPKTSSRAITSAAGTADAVETLARVDFSLAELKKIVGETGACLAWGGALGLAPADDKLIQVEKMLNLDPEPQLLASILSKKIAVGSKYVLIDIPCGPGAKVTREKAHKLGRTFLLLAKRLGLKMTIAITDGSQPIGNGIGPALEIRDVIRVLTRDKAPADLEKKSILLAGKILELTKKATRGTGWRKAKKILDEGSALEKFKQIIHAQGGSLDHIPEAKYRHTILSHQAGTVRKIQNRPVNLSARIAGCPQDKAAGMYLHVHVGTRVKKNDPLVTLYAESKFKLNAARAFFAANHPIELE